MARTALSKQQALENHTIDQRVQQNAERLAQISQKTFSQLTSEEKDFLLRRFFEANGFVKPE